MSRAMWIVAGIGLVSCMLAAAAAIAVGQLRLRLQKRCPLCGRASGKEMAWKLIPGTLKTTPAKGGDAGGPQTRARLDVSYKCQVCGYRWTKAKSVSHVTI